MTADNATTTRREAARLIRLLTRVEIDGEQAPDARMVARDTRQELQVVLASGDPARLTSALTSARETCEGWAEEWGIRAQEVRS